MRRKTLFLLVVLSYISVTSSCNSCCASCSSCTTLTCVETCPQKCCSSSDCCDKCSSPTPATTPTGPSSGTTRRTDCDDSNTISVSNNASNNIENHLSINNTVVHTNRINLLISISNINTNNVVCGEGCSESSTTRPTRVPPHTSPPPPVTPTTTTTTTTRSECCTDRIVPVGIPVPVAVPVPIYLQPPPNCCYVLNPCVTQQCTTYTKTCGSYCTSSFMYSGMNPCGGGGCRRRSHWTTNDGYTQDCSGCTEDSFRSYSDYRRCHGCFYI
ncbi:uncharacterized protein LOC126264560 [Aethina tumida]|uniref:uncharacterized protein LOC126264560 n=1 Tax=Aethina tumida TaxID=116153 RepID=UPI002148CA8F|nr:uncharacterized protein LOC126264560 [Aethina tumida]